MGPCSCLLLLVNVIFTCCAWARSRSHPMGEGPSRAVCLSMVTLATLCLAGGMTVGRFLMTSNHMNWWFCLNWTWSSWFPALRLCCWNMLLPSLANIPTYLLMCVWGGNSAFLSCSLLSATGMLLLIRWATAAPCADFSPLLAFDSVCCVVGIAGELHFPDLPKGVPHHVNELCYQEAGYRLPPWDSGEPRGLHPAGEWEMWISLWELPPVPVPGEPCVLLYQWPCSHMASSCWEGGLRRVILHQGANAVYRSAMHQWQDLDAS